MWPFKKKKKLSPIVNTADSGLTDKQICILQQAECPDCGCDLFEGPCGGMMMNVVCDNGHRFNITNPEIGDIAPFFAERIKQNKTK